MDPNEFPTLQEANGDNSNLHSSDTSDLSTSWADVAKSNASILDNEKENKKPETTEAASSSSNSNDLNASFAEVAGHEQKLKEEFPTPEEANLGSGEMTSSGVGDLLNKPKEDESDKSDPTEPPHPERSFADVTSNAGFPKPESDSSAPQTESLSHLPDVKDMLEQPSVNIPPPPSSQSFAKIAAKEIPPENRPLSDRAKTIINSNPTEEPTDFNHDNFPTLAQSNLMAEQNASGEERAAYSEISRLENLVDDNENDKKEKTTEKKTMSFAAVTSSNLENAPPSAISHVDAHPVYDEDTILLASAKREERKLHQVENDDTTKVNEITPEMKKIAEQKKEEKEEKHVQKSRGIKNDTKDDFNEADGLGNSLDRFDRKHRGKITIFDTMSALYHLGYSWFTIIPATLLMHLRLSPLSSPHSFPFYYRSLSDLILLPIYTKNLGAALTYQTPMLYQQENQKLVTQYGHKEGATQGLGYWDGLKAMKQVENKTHLRWWQWGLWTVHRIQWTLTYTMLHDPKTGLVTVPTLDSLKNVSKH